LEARLEIIPKTVDHLTSELTAAQMSLEKTKKAERERLFLVYAKQWWKEYCQIRPSQSDRRVKIFAQVNWILAPLFSLLSCLAALHGITSDKGS